MSHNIPEFMDLAIEARDLLKEHGIELPTDTLAGHLALWCQQKGGRPNSWYQERLQESNKKYLKACDIMISAAKNMDKAAKDLEEAVRSKLN